MAITHERHLAQQQQTHAPTARYTWQGPDLNTPITFTNGRNPYSSHSPQQARVTRAYEPDEEDELDGDDGGAGYGSIPRSALRWRGIKEQPAPMQAAPQVRGRATREVAVAPARPRPPSGRTYWLVYLLAGMAVMAGLAMALSSLGSWWQGVQDGWTYGLPRTYQVDSVVGHNHDSVAHPSHFLALNLRGHLVVVELPAGDPSKGVIYPGPALDGTSAEQQVVTLSFVDVDRDGTPDLVLRHGEVAEVWLNKGGRFRAPFG